MFETLTKIKNWIVGIFAVIGGIAVVWALKKDTRSEKEFKADLKKIKGEGKKLDKKIENIVDQIDKGEFKSAKLKIIILKWKPIGHKQIDTDMTKYYKEISQNLKDSAK